MDHKIGDEVGIYVRGKLTGINQDAYDCKKLLYTIELECHRTVEVPERAITPYKRCFACGRFFMSLPGTTCEECQTNG